MAQSNGDNLASNMSKRETMAMYCLAGILANPKVHLDGSQTSDCAIVLADKLLEGLEK